MRHVGPFGIPAIPDTVLSLQLTAGSAQAFDYPTGTDFVRVSVGSTGNLALSAIFNPASTGAALPTTAGGISTGSSGWQINVGQGDDRVYQRPRGSTGFSLIAGSSALVSVEFWTRGG